MDTKVSRWSFWPTPTRTLPNRPQPSPGQLKGKQHDDLVLGGKLVSEATEDELRWATSLSQRRLDFLNWIMALLDQGTLPDWQMSVFSSFQETVAALQ
jgi:hypothetical protein